MRSARASNAASFIVAGAALAGALVGCELVADVGSLSERRDVDGGGQDSTSDDGGSEAGSTDAGLDSGPDTGSGDASDASDASAVTATSCIPAGDGRSNCGGGAESCCASLLVTGGTYSRSYDGTSPDCGQLSCTDPQYQASVADFRLDRYEVTVGRFRKFVDAVVGGWRPAAGSGKHTHLNGGSGLAASGGGFETGWDTTWNANLPAAKATWDSANYLVCDATYATWTPSADATELRPINCIDWYAASAFCIWDGGFLPSEAEWNYAAAAGSEQRSYPWGATAPGANASLGVYSCYYKGAGPGGCTGITNIAPVGATGGGGSKYGQADLAGNVWEWTLDWYKTPYNEPSCINCAHTTASAYHVIRGGSFNGFAVYLLAGYRSYDTPVGSKFYTGARCARTP